MCDQRPQRARRVRAAPAGHYSHSIPPTRAPPGIHTSELSESVLTPIKLLVPNETVPEETVPEETVPIEATASKHHMGGYFGDVRTV